MTDRHATLHAEGLRLAASAARIGFWSWQPGKGFRWDDSLYALLGLDPSHHEASSTTLLPFIYSEDRHLL